MNGASVYRIRIKPLEPLMLRGPGEFDPSARGVTSAAASQVWPSPSTITGLFCAALLWQPPQRSARWDAYIQSMDRIMNTVGIEWVRGPYLVRGRTTYVPIVLRGRLRVIDYDQLKITFESCRGYLERDDLESFAEKLEELIDRRAEPVVQERVGIALRSREGAKAVREGYLYTATFVSLGDASIVVEVGLKDSLSRLNGTVAAFGGERRIVKLEAVEIGQEERIASLEFKGGYAVLLSPLIIPSPPMSIVRKGGEVYVEVDGRRVIHLVSGLVGLKGLGFSVADRSRKPMYPAIYEGSIIKVEEVLGDAAGQGVYACVRNSTSITKFLGRIGYGSVAPLP